MSSVLPEAPLLNATQADGMMNHISPGALMRGSLVFGVLCAVVVIYIAFRTCRSVSAGDWVGLCGVGQV